MKQKKFEKTQELMAQAIRKFLEAHGVRLQWTVEAYASISVGVLTYANNPKNKNIEPQVVEAVKYISRLLTEKQQRRFCKEFLQKRQLAGSIILPVLLADLRSHNKKSKKSRK